MKVLGILGAQRKDGVTAKMLAAVFQGIATDNTTEVIYLEDFVLKADVPGTANPELDLIESKMRESDVWVLAAPTYWGSLSGRLKNLFDCLRQRLVRFDHTGTMHPASFKNKHYISLTNCYTSSFENMICGVTDASLRLCDKVMSAAGVIKIGEAVVTGTWGMETLTPKKKKECLDLGHKINRIRRRDDQTVKRYFELFFMVAVMALITMLLQKACASFIPLDNFWFNYLSFTVIFFILLASMLHFVTFMKHKRH
ncbi:NAD(P)H-dependent oxidoreductase [Liquorilactobacillus satsumensis]|uniref:NAD(P)H-dependent oxidoreductase n=1 Tax=Liquorilactobacillus satsumensis TaxID=259059 RepID=UPI0021C4A1DB|nr:NAD(P)H-dependent oxidoreductase [Liquorilactobacillus satsumensis]MCP9328033.1 NAD(P)H-dependent oxidoreductase [Liquorilactobacillus satsumensis]